MKLSELLEQKNLKAADIEKASGVNKASLSTHLKFERGEGGQPVGLRLALRLVKAFPEITLADLRKDLAEQLEGCH